MTNTTVTDGRPEPWETWTYGLLSITFITIISVAGIGLMPLVSKKVYYRCLTLFVGLGVGTLTGSAIFHLLPQTFGVVTTDGTHEYLHRALFVVIGVYLFYFADKLLKFIMQMKKNRKKPMTVQYHSEVYSPTNGQAANGQPTNEQRAKSLETSKPSTQLLLGEDLEDGGMDPHANQYKIRSSAKTKGFDVELPKRAHGICNHDHDIKFNEGDSVIATVAWMIIFGDGLHNFVDGLSIGATFTQSLMGGWAIVVAVLCEEFPHELGDVAILVSAGMSLKQAFTYNLLSAVTCYAGFVVGVFMGELPGISPYIFALAAGMFLYIGLTSMIPEMNATLDRQLEKQIWRGGLVFVLQSSGILIGLALMYVMSRYGGMIQFA